MINVSSELKFKTARSGGKGGQNVNKVETMVEGYFDVTHSNILTEEQKERIQKKLAGRINADGMIQIKSQVHRSQLANKEEVVKKFNLLIAASLKKEKKRVPTKPGKHARENRLASKKKDAVTKETRKRIRLTDH